MQQLPPWARTLLIIGIVALLLLPFIFLAIRTFAIPARLSSFFGVPSKSAEFKQYGVSGDAQGFALALTDVMYLDFVTAKMGIFGQKAILDPRAYRGTRDVNMRYTVSRMRFELVSEVSTPLFVEPGKNAFASQGDYRVEGDTLVVSVWLNEDGITGGEAAQKFALEDVFLRTAVKTLKFATGLSDNASNLRAFTAINSDMQEQLYSGMMPWPFTIETK